LATFGKMDTQIDPSELGKTFPITTQVTFTVHGKKQTGKVTKQLRNAAIVEIDETTANTNLINESNGVAVINYKQLEKI